MYLSVCVSVCVRFGRDAMLNAISKFHFEVTWDDIVTCCLSQLQKSRPHYQYIYHPFSFVVYLMVLVECFKRRVPSSSLGFQFVVLTAFLAALLRAAEGERLGVDSSPSQLKGNRNKKFTALCPTNAARI